MVFVEIYCNYYYNYILDVLIFMENIIVNLNHFVNLMILHKYVKQEQIINYIVMLMIYHLILLNQKKNLMYENLFDYYLSCFYIIIIYIRILYIDIYNTYKSIIYW